MAHIDSAGNAVKQRGFLRRTIPWMNYYSDNGDAAIKFQIVVWKAS
jgi:hypothetical protein